MFHQIIKQFFLINYWIPILQWWTRIGVSIKFCIFPSLVIFLDFDGSNRLNFKFYEIKKNILIAIELEKGNMSLYQSYVQYFQACFFAPFLCPTCKTTQHDSI
jgi:hypothetical protein